MKARLKSLIGLLILLGVIGFVGARSWIELSLAEQHYMVTFPRGAGLTAGGEATLAEALQQLRSDDGLLIRIEGHTGTRGDPEANLALSEQRAAAVREELVSRGIAPERITVEGYGGTRPLARQAEETDRAYQLRLSRAEITLSYTE